MNKQKRTVAGQAAQPGPAVPVVEAVENPLPESMQPGWDPFRPGREAQSRYLDACLAEGVPADDPYWF